MRAMQRPTKVLLVGFAVAALLAGAAFLISYRADQAVATAIAACNAESDRHELRPANPAEPWMSDRLLCDESDFYLPVTHKWVGTQKAIADTIASRSASAAPGILYGIAVLVAFLALIPWTWYFLLRRLREVRDALTGR